MVGMVWYAERPTPEANGQLRHEVAWFSWPHVGHHLQRAREQPLPPYPPPFTNRPQTFFLCALPSFPTSTLQLHRLISSIYPPPNLIASILPHPASSTNLSATASTPHPANPIPASPFPRPAASSPYLSAIAVSPTLPTLSLLLPSPPHAASSTNFSATAISTPHPAQPYPYTPCPPSTL